MIRYSWLISFNFYSPPSFRCIKTLWARHRVSSNGSFQRSMLPCFMFLVVFLVRKPRKHHKQPACPIRQFDEIIASSQAPICTTNHHPWNWGMATWSNRCSPFWGVKSWLRGVLFRFQVGKLRFYCLCSSKNARHSVCHVGRQMWQPGRRDALTSTCLMWSKWLRFMTSPNSEVRLWNLSFHYWFHGLGKPLSRILEGGIDHSPHCHPCPLSLFASHSVLFYFTLCTSQFVITFIVNSVSFFTCLPLGMYMV